MSDAWNEIQAIKSKRNSLREKLEKRKRERQDILTEATSTLPAGHVKIESATGSADTDRKPAVSRLTADASAASDDPDVERLLLQILSDQALVLPITGKQLFQRMNSMRFKPVAHAVLNNFLEKLAAQSYVCIQPTDDEAMHDAAVVPSATVTGLSDAQHAQPCWYVVTLVEHSRVQSLYEEMEDETDVKIEGEIKRKYDDNEHSDESSSVKFSRSSAASSLDRKSGLFATKDSSNNTSDIMSLLAMPSTREKQIKLVGEEILELLSKPTAKERSLAEKFKSQGGAQVMEFCPYGTRTECVRVQHEDEQQQAEADRRKVDGGGVVLVKTETSNSATASGTSVACKKLHFKKIIQSHTDETLGDCSFLNTCFHMDSCKYVHYEVDSPAAGGASSAHKHAVLGADGQSQLHGTAARHSATTAAGVHVVAAAASAAEVVSAATASKLEGGRALRAMALAKIKQRDPSTTLHPPQWIQCDLRFLDMTVLGKFAVIMADPPWDIHMELPYGTMSDDEMRQLGVPALQDDGLIFLWVTGRAMELGRECLKLWGYERFDELIWVKTNQLQRIIRTGRTGHWLNHGKEHCLVGTKGNPLNLNRGLDCDVIVAEVRATSHKPDEIYGIIERLSPGTRKIELFGRPHNVQPNWITLGNQLDGIRLVDPELISQFQKRYPDGNCMAPNNK